MSKKQNSEWLESARENFEQALSDTNMMLAQSIINDTRDEGFRTEANHMEAQLNALSLEDLAPVDEDYE